MTELHHWIIASFIAGAVIGACILAWLLSISSDRASRLADEALVEAMRAAAMQFPRSPYAELLKARDICEKLSPPYRFHLPVPPAQDHTPKHPMPNRPAPSLPHRDALGRFTSKWRAKR